MSVLAVIISLVTIALLIYIARRLGLTRAAFVHLNDIRNRPTWRRLSSWIKTTLLIMVLGLVVLTAWFGQGWFLVLDLVLLVGVWEIIKYYEVKRQNKRWEYYVIPVHEMQLRRPAGPPGRQVPPPPSD